MSLPIFLPVIFRHATSLELITYTTQNINYANFTTHVVCLLKLIPEGVKGFTY